MMNSKFTKWTLGAGITLIVIMLVLTGCSQSPVSINNEESQPVLLKRSASYAKELNLSPVNDFHCEQVISAKDGGTLTFYDVTLEIPPGAVKDDTVFSIKIPDINVFYNEFGTEGLVFNVPVTVTMSYREADLTSVKEETIRIAFYNEDSERFEDIDGIINYKNMTVTARLYHFSAYGLISDE